MAEFYVRTSLKGKAQGPFSGRQLKQLAESGQLQPEHLISPDGGTSWHEANTFSGLGFAATVVERSQAATVSPPPGSAGDLEDLISSHEPIASSRLIESIAAAHGVTFDQASGVVDGFWDYLVDTAVALPHFGSFWLQGGLDGRTSLQFRSRSVQELRTHVATRGRARPSETWIDHWERLDSGDVTKLSLKRRITVSISARSDLDTRMVFRLLWDLIETVTGIMAAGRASIRWARRGEMALASDGDSYSFRTYSRLAEALPPLVHGGSTAYRHEEGSGRM